MIIDVSNTLGKHIYKDEITAESLLKQMDSSKVDMAVIHCHGEYLDNESIKKAVISFPDRFIGLYTPNPWSENAASDLEVAFESGYFKGLYIDPIRQGFILTEKEILEPLFEVCSRYGYPVWCYAAADINCNPILLEPYLQKYPKVPFIVGRMGLQYDNSSACSLAQKYENVYLETSTSMDFNVFRAIKSAGVDRVLLGTGTPDAGYQDLEIQKVVNASQDKDSANKILGINASKIFMVEGGKN